MPARKTTSPKTKPKALNPEPKPDEMPDMKPVEPLNLSPADDNQNPPPPPASQSQPEPVPEPPKATMEVVEGMTATGSLPDGDLSADHIADIEIEGEAIEPTEQPGGLHGHVTTLEGSAVLTKDAFVETVGGCFKMAGGVTGLETLTAAPDRADAIPAFEVIYEVASETPSLRWLIEPQQLWMQRTIVVAAFALPVARETAREIKDKRGAGKRKQPMGGVHNAA